VESHGNNLSKEVIAIVPARYASVRLPAKLLLPLAGKPIVVHTLEKAASAKLVTKVIAATDDDRIAEAASAAGFEVMMTSSAHESGSDRVAEVAERFSSDSIIVNVQGDEPLITGEAIDSAIEALIGDEEADIASTFESFLTAADVLSPDVVKVVVDDRGHASYFSRSAIPFLREKSKEYGSLERALEAETGLLGLFKKHQGLYVYRRDYLLRFSKMPKAVLETTEVLEQLRALAAGAKIKMVHVTGKSIGVDTAGDYEKVKSILEH
jgi:3-deoxy-manno-octulosonate cytidylyltransferase (CMP-KDO synthetase)